MLNNQELMHLIKQGNEEAKEQFVKDNMGLVYAMVKRFKQSSYSKEDIISVGMLGLIKAINNFDESYNVTFSTYAVPIILGEIKRYFRDDGSMHVTRSVKENYLLLLREKDRLEQSEGREVSYYELAEQLHMDLYDVIEAFEANQYVSSLDESISNDEHGSIVSDFVPDKEKLDIVMLIAMKEELKRLPQRDQLLIYYRYDLDYNQSQIANIFKVSQVQISRMEKRILKELRERILG